jgi:hypothetical protein
MVVFWRYNTAGGLKMSYAYGTPEHELELIEWERSQPDHTGGEFSDMTTHEIMQITGGDCPCPKRGCMGNPETMAQQDREDAAQQQGPLAYYRFLRAEYPGIPAVVAWKDAKRNADADACDHCTHELWDDLHAQGLEADYVESAYDAENPF